MDATEWCTGGCWKATALVWQVRVTHRASSYLVIEEVTWLILPNMLQVAKDIYEDVTRRKASHEQCPLPAPASKKTKGGLRARDPW